MELEIIIVSDVTQIYNMLNTVFRRKFTSGTVNMVKPMTGKITGPRGASVSVMLNAVKLFSKHFCL